MPTTLNYLRAADSLTRFPSGTTIDQTTQYLNNDGVPRFRWSAQNATLSAVANVVKIPSCNTLFIAPQSAGDIIIRLENTTVPGTVSENIDSVEYIFHALLLCTNPATVITKLTSEFQDETPKQKVLERDIFTVCRSNRLVFSPTINQPTSQYQGSDPLVDLQIQISNHGGSPIYLTFPALINAHAWKFNSFVSNSLAYIPTVFRDLDEVQDPEFPFFKLIDALSYTMGDAAQTISNWFRFEPDELPSNALETDEWVRSQLTDANLASAETLNWLSTFAGRKLFRQTYAVDPNTSELTSWQTQSYPLAMTDLIQVDFATVDNFSISADLIVVPKFDPVVTSTTVHVDLSSGLIAGANFSGYTVSTGERVLVRHQNTPSENGIYIVAASGAASRATDADTSGEFTDGKAVYVNSGTFAGTYWKANIAGSFTLGTTSLTFSQTSSPGIMDGNELVNGSKVLLLNQTDPRENGVYIVSSSTTATRISELNTSPQLTNTLFIEVLYGERFANTLWRIFIERPIEIDVDPIQILFVDRQLDFLRAQVETAMYGHSGGSQGAIASAARRFLVGDRQIAIGPNSPSQYYITIKTIIDETPGVDEVDSWATSAVAATTANITIATSLNSGDVIDGITLSNGDRVLVKNQTSESENGIYVVSASPSRALDADTAGEFTLGKTIYVTSGQLNGDRYYTVSQVPAVINVSPINFERASTLGSSDIILQALEPTRPIGYQFIHQTVPRFSFTLNSAALGRLDQGTLD